MLRDNDIEWIRAATALIDWDDIVRCADLQELWGALEAHLKQLTELNDPFTLPQAPKKTLWNTA